MDPAATQQSLSRVLTETGMEDVELASEQTEPSVSSQAFQVAQAAFGRFFAPDSRLRTAVRSFVIVSIGAGYGLAATYTTPWFGAMIGGMLGFAYVVDRESWLRSPHNLTIRSVDSAP